MNNLRRTCSSPRNKRNFGVWTAHKLVFCLPNIPFTTQRSLSLESLKNKQVYALLIHYYNALPQNGYVLIKIETFGWQIARMNLMKKWN